MKLRKQTIALTLGAVGAIAVIFAVGFEQQQPKFAVVDLNEVIRQSELGQTNNDAIRNAFTARESVLEFMSAQRVLTTEQAQRIRDLTLKTTLTAAEKTELETVKAAVIDAKKTFDALQQKPNPTEDDRDLLADYNSRMQSTGRLLQEWDLEFSDGLSALRNELGDATLDAARAAVAKVGADGGYTMVFESQIAIYGANDITAEAIKAMNDAD